MSDFIQKKIDQYVKTQFEPRNHVPKSPEKDSILNILNKSGDLNSEKDGEDLEKIN